MKRGSGSAVLAAVLGLGAAVSLAHSDTPLPDSKIAPPARQFGLPFAGEPGPDAWLLGQTYGSTTGAYRRRNTEYRAGQGIHFGVDLSARCGTPVLAVGDGVVAEVDGPHGSPPHNLVIDHAGGLSSLYGHLLKRPAVRVGQRVKRGEVVARSGDSQFTCVSAPHLHLEIRDNSHQRFLNPVLYVNADWASLALAGGFARGFQRDLSSPRRWQRLEDQPQARRGGALLNAFARPWPPAPEGPALAYPGRIRALVGPEADRGEATQSPPSSPRRLTSNGCCANPSWSADSSRVYVVDKPGGEPATIYAASALGPSGLKAAFSSVAYLSLPSATPSCRPSSILERVSDGKRVRLPTNSGNVLYSPSEARVAWGVTQSQGNFDRLGTRVSVADLTGTATGLSASPPRTVATVYGGGLAGWLDERRIVLTGKSAPADETRSLRVLDVQTGQGRAVSKALNFRNVSLAPGGRWIAYVVAFDAKGKNGTFLADARSGAARRVGFFGSFRWRDANRIAFVPLEPGAPSHRVLEFDARTGATRELVKLNAKVALDQWQVSPDGRRMLFVNAADSDIYALDLPQ